MVEQITKRDIGVYLKTQLDFPATLEGSVDAPTQALYNAINHFLHACGETPLDPVALNDEQIESFRAFMYDYSETLNPFSQAIESPAITPEWYYTQMQALTEAVDTFLAEKNVHMVSKGHAYPVGMTGDEGAQLWRRRLLKDALGNVTASYEKVDRIDTTRPFIIGLSGTNLFHANTPLMRGFTKLMALAVGGDDYCANKQLDCYVVTLPDAHRTRYQADNFATNLAPTTHISQPAQSLVDDIIIPSLGITNQTAPAELDNKLHSLNFFAYSYGTAMAKQIRNALHNRLSELGFEAQDIKHALSQAYALNFGPTVRMEPADMGDFSSVYVAATQDFPVRSKTNMRDYMGDARDAIPLGDNALFIRSHSPRQSTNLAEDAHRHSSNDSGHGIRSYATKSAVIHNPTYVGSFLRYALEGKQGALDTHTQDAPARQIGDKTGAASIPGKYVIAALRQSAEKSIEAADGLLQP